MTEDDEETMIPMKLVTANPIGIVKSWAHSASLGRRAKPETDRISILNIIQTEIRGPGSDTATAIDGDSSSTFLGSPHYAEFKRLVIAGRTSATFLVAAGTYVQNPDRSQ